jgi:hypothetical protein
MQDRELTFSIKIEGSLPTIFTDQLEFSLYHESNFAEVDKTSEWSFDTQEDITVTAINTRMRNDQHKYNKPFVAEVNYNGSTIKSDTLKIDVYELWIDYVKYNTKPWKAVIGEPFELSGMGSTDCTDWDWNLEKVDNIGWSPTGGNAKTSTLTIPYSNLTGAKNTYFGDTYGNVIVKCKDGEGNEHIFKSTDMEPAQKVKIFFSANKNLQGYSPNTFYPPCWFLFWKEFIPWGRISELVYAGDNSGLYGETLSADRITKIFNNARKENDETHHKGLHTFYETMAHENHHIVLWEERWPNGYDSTDDIDGDFYPDSWEATNQEAIDAGLTVGVNDRVEGGTQKGVKLDESLCRQVERNLNSSLYDNQDWSYDPDGLYQGKQW